jgi:hypothetical protein
MTAPLFTAHPLPWTICVTGDGVSDHLYSDIYDANAHIVVDKDTQLAPGYWRTIVSILNEHRELRAELTEFRQREYDRQKHLLEGLL